VPESARGTVINVIVHAVVTISGKTHDLEKRIKFKITGGNNGEFLIPLLMR
jgi:hypothetical protein